MTAAVTALAGQLAATLAKGTTARELAAVVETLRAALLDEVDDRIPAVLSDAAFDLEQLQDEMDEDACTCPMSPTYSTSIDPPERMIGRNRECPVHGHGEDPDAEREAKMERKWEEA
jgi:hypothetical protein